MEDSNGFLKDLSPAIGGRKSIICVNSNLQLLEQLEQFLLDTYGQHYIIETAESPSEAMRVIEDLEFLDVSIAVLLATYSMPEMNGIDFIARINKHIPTCKTILLAEEVSEAALEMAINDIELYRFIRMPYKRNVLEHMIHDALYFYEQDLKLKLMHDQLRQSEYEKSLILDSISREMLFIDSNYDILWMNFHNNEKQTVPYGKCYELLYKRNKPCQGCKAMDVFKLDGQVSCELEFPSEQFKIATYYPVKDKYDQKLGVVISLVDITNRKIQENMNVALLEMAKYVHHADQIIAVYIKAHELISDVLPLNYMCVAGADFDEVFIEYLEGSDKLLSCKKHFEVKDPYLADRIELAKMLTINGLEYEINRNDIDQDFEILFSLDDKAIIIRFDYTYHLMEYEISFIRAIIEQLKIGVSRIENLKRITYQANHDALTSLYNREYFMRTLNGKMRAMRDKDMISQHYGLAIIDLNYFKDINDSFGHVIGDEVLYVVARRMSKVLRHGDIVARIGGDEFALLISYNTRDEIAVVLKRMQTAISEAIFVENNQIHVGSSIGVVVDIFKYDLAEDLIRDADSAMYEAKRDKNKEGRFCFFEKDIEAKLKLHNTIEKALAEAIEGNEFKLLYQPIVDISSGRMVGCEAFIRWEDHYRPDEFIPVADENGMIYEINDSVMEEVQFALNFMDNQICDKRLFISVNFTSKQLMNMAYLSKISQLDIDFSRLIIEITEKPMFKNYEKARAHISYLLNLGLRVHLDDFGTGYSSISHLNSSNIDHIKIDHDLIGLLPEDASSCRIVKAIMDVARDMDKKVTAEGVENDRQLSLLKDLGCHYVQGYHISKPMTLLELCDYAKAQSSKENRL